jgi:CheY-like chemotaxis protein
LQTKNVRVLVVDDHADTLGLLTRLLRQHGYHVLPVSTFADAIRTGQTHPFDILLTDLQLADGWGWSLVERLRGAGRTFRAIAVSGHGMATHLAQSAATGFCAHLTKPVDLNQLITTVERCAGDGGGVRC